MSDVSRTGTGKMVKVQAGTATKDDEEGGDASEEPETYPDKMKRYEAKKEKLRAKLKKLDGKEQRARAGNADRKDIRDMGAPPHESGSDDFRSCSSYHRGDTESEFAPSGSDI